MPEESATTDLVELGRCFLEAANRRDLDAMLSFFAPDGVWETVGLGTAFEGPVAIRGFWEDWFAAYEEHWVEQKGALDLGNGVTFAVLITKARPVGSSGYVQHKNAGVTTWVDGLIKRSTHYPDPDEGRVAAERLAEERG
jgi:ketosteroid isomerase-like protein